MKRRLRLLWLLIGILAVLALVGCSTGITQTLTTTTTVNKTSTISVPAPNPGFVEQKPPPPPAPAAPVPSSTTAGAQPAPSPKPPAPGGGQPPPAGGAPPPPPGGAPPPPPGGAAPAPAPPPMSGKMVVTSTAVTNGVIADAYSCIGVTAGTVKVPKSLPLSWTGAPAGTKSFAVIISTIRGGGDEGIFFLVYNIPGTATGLPENLADNLVDPKVGTIGLNDQGTTVLEPPCGGGPGVFKYTVTLYALSTTPEVLDNPKSVNAASLRGAMKTITLDAAALTFTVTLK